MKLLVVCSDETPEWFSPALRYSNSVRSETEIFLRSFRWWCQGTWDILYANPLFCHWVAAPPISASGIYQLSVGLKGLGDGFQLCAEPAATILTAAFHSSWRFIKRTMKHLVECVTVGKSWFKALGVGWITSVGPFSGLGFCHATCWKILTFCWSCFKMASVPVFFQATWMRFWEV